MNHQVTLPATPPRWPGKLAHWLDHYFRISAEGSSLRRETLAGITTFLAAAYVIVVNPDINSAAGIPFSAGVTATVLVSFLGTLAMALYARNPILIAPGMGINILFAYTMVVGADIPLQVALGCVLWSSLAFTLLAFFNVRQKVIEGIPANLRNAIACGMGLFIALIGLVNARFIVSHPFTVVHAAPFDPVILTFLAGLVVTITLVVRRVPGALILGIITTTLMAIPIGRLWGNASAFAPEGSTSATLVNWQGLFAAPDFSFIGQIDLLGALHIDYLPYIFVLVFTNFFEALSAFLGISEAGNLKDAKGEPRRIKQSMHVDALSSLASAPLGTSPAIVYIESIAGISQGGRTGMVALVAALLFLPFLFLSPLLALVPAIATAPVLVMIGVFMMDTITKIDWLTYEEAIPAFMVIVLIPLTYSMTLGIALGFILYVLLKLLTGKAATVKPIMWAVAVLSVFLVVRVQS
jgi:AGZA family xanthine/uracil permease-like MFS transporter